MGERGLKGTDRGIDSQALLLAHALRRDDSFRAKLIRSYWRVAFRLTRGIERLANKRPESLPSPKVLNFGCGNRFHPDAVNSDLFAPHRLLLGRRRPDLYWSGSQTLPRLAQHFEAIVCEHVIEHVLPDQVLDLFRNFHHLLSSRGLLAISFPDVRRVLAGGFCQGYSSPTVSLNALIYRHGHCFMYDPPLVQRLLLRAGFARTEEAEWADVPLQRFLQQQRVPESSYVIAHKA